MNRSILGLAATVLLTLTVQTGFAAGLVHVPATPQAAASANLIARADRALRDYVAACSTGNEEAVARIVTSDAVLEYALEEPGTYLTVEAAALSANRSVNAEPTGTGARLRICGFFQRAIQTRYSFTTRFAPVFDRRPSSRTPNIWPCSRCAVIESSRCACSAPTPAISRRSTHPWSHVRSLPPASTRTTKSIHNPRRAS